MDATALPCGLKACFSTTSHSLLAFFPAFSGAWLMENTLTTPSSNPTMTVLPFVSTYRDKKKEERKWIKQKEYADDEND
jgi:hypothetical protein